MEITRMMRIAEQNRIYMKHTDCGKIYLNYDNVRILFNKGALLKFSIEMDDWYINNMKNDDTDLVIKTGRFSLKVKREDVEDFIKVVNEAVYNFVPILNEYKQMTSSQSLFKDRIN